MARPRWVRCSRKRPRNWARPSRSRALSASRAARASKKWKATSPTKSPKWQARNDSGRAAYGKLQPPRQCVEGHAFLGPRSGGMPVMLTAPRYAGVLLKVSGEAWMGEDNYGIDVGTVDRIASDVKEAADSGS